MNIFHKVTLESLKKNRTRTIVTIIGILLSAAMICAVTTSVSSIQDYFLKTVIWECGDWHGRILDSNGEKAQWLEEQPEIQDVTRLQHLGYAKIANDNEDKPYLYLLASDPGEIPLGILPMEGRFPENAGEILLPDHLLAHGEVQYRIGDVLTLDLGDRMEDGYILGQKNPFYESENEELQVRETRSYTLVGVYSRMDIEPYSAPGYTAFTVSDTEGGIYDLYYHMDGVNGRIDGIYDFVEKNGLPDDWNSSLLAYSGVLRYTPISDMLTTLAGILILLILFGSVALIYNAFSISVAERTKQFGLLSSIGATKKQLRKMVRYEALVVSAIGIPLGILSGIAGIGITLHILSEKIQRMTGLPFPVEVHVSWISVVAAAVIALFTVLLSAWIPSKRAMRVSAVESIRQSQDISIRPREVKTWKLTEKLFGLPGVLASKNYKRSRKKYRATILSLFMSIVLFVSSTSYVDYLFEVSGMGYDPADYDLMVYCNADADGKNGTLLEGIPGVTEVHFTREYFLNVELEPQDRTPEMQGEENVTFQITVISDEDFRSILEENGIAPEPYFAEPLALAVDGGRVLDPNAGRFVKKTLLAHPNFEAKAKVAKDFPGYCWIDSRDGIHILAEGDGPFYDDNGHLLPDLKLKQVSDAEYYENYAIPVGEIITERPYYLNPNEFLLLYPESHREKLDFVPEYVMESTSYYLKSQDPAQSEAAILDGPMAEEWDVYNLAAQEQNERDFLLVIQVFAYGFITLISLIAAANVFNTISTNIGLRQKEFAMLKSMGMGRRAFRRMMDFECLLYGFKSLLYGLPASAFVTYCIYEAVGVGMDTDFRLPWKAMGIATLSVFLVVFSTMLYATQKLKKENPVEVLRRENF